MIYDAEYVIDFFNLTNYTEEQIGKYIDHFTDSIQRRTGATDTTDGLFQDAVLAAIACKISRDDKSALSDPNKVVIGNYSEEKESRFFRNNDPSYCDLAQEALTELVNSLNKSFGFKVFKRQGTSEKRGFYQ